jgi:hypothetical protein
MKVFAADCAVLKAFLLKSLLEIVAGEEKKLLICRP